MTNMKINLDNIYYIIMIGRWFDNPTSVIWKILPKSGPAGISINYIG